ncbi:unnamed protein product [Amoebophrya sp. A120]|nr:unnamed protein product [Amoebophrya sp. A120]|eukprot:GSA120T00003519001.1
MPTSSDGATSTSSASSSKMTFLFACVKLGAALLFAGYAYKVYADSVVLQKTKKDEEEKENKEVREPACEPDPSDIVSNHGCVAMSPGLITHNDPNSSLLSASTPTSAGGGTEHLQFLCGGGAAGMPGSSSTGTNGMLNKNSRGNNKHPDPESVRRNIELGLGATSKKKPENLFFNLLGLYQGIPKQKQQQ